MGPEEYHQEQAETEIESEEKDGESSEDGEKPVEGEVVDDKK